MFKVDCVMHKKTCVIMHYYNFIVCFEILDVFSSQKDLGTLNYRNKFISVHSKYCKYFFALSSMFFFHGLSKKN